jgi:hypothetical protein
MQSTVAPVVYGPTSQDTEGAISPQHPILQLGQLRIPGPAIPIVLVVFTFIVGSRTRSRLSSDPVFKERFRYSQAVVHLLLYIYSVRTVFHEEIAESNNTLPFVEYVALVLGEAAPGESNFGLYTSLAIGWVLPLWSPSSSTSKIAPLSRRAWISLVLSIPSALGTSKQLSTGATLSALSVLTRMIFLALTGSIAAHELSATTLAGILLPLLARACYATLLGVSHDQPWLNGFRRTLRGWLRCMRQYGIGLSTVPLQGAAATLTQLGAGWMLTSFLWSCFRWRWLFNGQASRPPTWTGFSLFSGYMFFFPVFVLVKWMRIPDEPTVDMNVVMRRQLANCLEAIWSTTCLYLFLWFISELLCGTLITY